MATIPQPKPQDGTGGPPRILITNAEERSMLAVTRSLHRAGYRVTAASPTRLAPGQWSRTCARRLSTADARSDAGQFVAELREELEARRYETVIAGSDSSLLSVSLGRDQLEGFTRLGLPAHAIVERGLSRTRLAEAAAQSGFMPPLSIRCSSGDQAIEAAKTLGFPVVLKSIDTAIAGTRSVQAVPKGRIARGIHDLTNALPSFQGGLLVQRYVPGKLISLGGAIAEGRLLALAVTRYTRTWPPDGGSISFGETIVSPPGLEDMALRLLTKIGWEGIFELELIESEADSVDSFVPIDLNPRPYGSMALATTAGAPLASIWCNWLLGRNRPQQNEPIRAGPGYRYRWEDAELRYSWWQLHHGRCRAATAPLRPHRRVTHAHFERSDPLPLVARGLYLGMSVARASRQ